MYEWEKRPWGRYLVLYDGEEMKVKIIEVDPGKRLSYQSHRRRKENWLFVKGEGFVIIDDMERVVKEGDTVFVDIEQRHRVGNTGEEVLRIVEVQSGDYFGEDDILRFQDDFGRV